MLVGTQLKVIIMKNHFALILIFFNCLIFCQTKDFRISGIQANKDYYEGIDKVPYNKMMKTFHFKDSVKSVSTTFSKFDKYEFLNIHLHYYPYVEFDKHGNVTSLICSFYDTIANVTKLGELKSKKYI